MRKPVLGALAAAAALGSVLSSTTPAAANGRFPASNQIVFSPTDPKVIFGRTTFALIPSSDDGATWSYLCEGLLALPTVTNYQDPEIAFTSNGTLVAGLFAPTRGLSVSKDLGCSWSCNATLDATRQVVDTVVRPDMQSHVLALVS
ncbi:MAG: sialidase family protein, partial [Polyangiaceae bacterium]